MTVPTGPTSVLPSDPGGLQMPRRRMQQPKPFRDGSFWRVRWREDVRDETGRLGAKRLSQVLGPAVGPEALSAKEVKKRAAEFFRPINERAYNPQSMMTVQQFVTQRFLPEVVRTMKYTGRRHYDYCFKKILPVLGEVPLRDLSVEIINGFITGMEGYSVQTQTHMKNALSAVVEHAKRVGYFTGDNPARLVRLPEMERKKKPALTFEQSQVVLANLAEPYQTMALMAISTSLNVAELCGLRWRRVNLGNIPILVDDDLIPPRCFAVRENYYNGHWGTVKTQARNRIQPLPLPVYHAIVAIYNTTKYNHPDDPVFASRTGTPVDAHNACNRVLKPAGKAAGVPSLSWHSFRRTTATLMGYMAVPMADRIATMGHSDASMTLYYSDSDLERRRTYLDDLAERVVPPKPVPISPTVGIV